MAIESAADLAVYFNADEFGIAAVYEPPSGGASLPCTVIRDNPDLDTNFGEGRQLRQADQLLFRVDEIPTPARGGRFTLANNEILTIQDDPQQRDADRALWTCTVR